MIHLPGLLTLGDVRSWATYDPRGVYRYALGRAVTGICIAWIMLNPSTAGHELDDPTIRKVRGFCERLGGWPLVGNLYAFRSTDPRLLRGNPARVGPDNDRVLAEIARRADLIICAWGGNAEFERASAVRSLLRASGKPLYALKVSKRTGQPWHPLYVPYASAHSPL